MVSVYEFLRACEVFFLATVDNDAPALRPFGAVMEYEGELYFSTGSYKDVYKQLTANPAIQIAALKSGTRRWIRISGMAVEVKDLSLKQMMLDCCPVLKKHFKSIEDERFALFKVTQMRSLINT